ncbi:MAG: trehalose-6-phosphate synthase [Bradymonadaceae bacterium]|nr:trehalose-6-phosphate synthase [Lujinxingiaceae bacterium]
MKAVDEFTIVSNRLPIVMHREDDGWHVESGSGGLVQAMSPILEKLGGRWIGWPGICAEDGNGWYPAIAQAGAGFRLEPVILTRAQVDGFYAGFSNSVIWPLFHGFADRCDFKPRFYQTYDEVNTRFAEAIAPEARSNDFLWVHDYHLIHVGQKLRTLGVDARLSFFLHIPFPSAENYTKLPWREEILEAMLAYDLVGLQTGRDRRNLVQCIERLMPELNIYEIGEMVVVEMPRGSVQIGVFPIGTDYGDFSRRAGSQAATERVAELRREIGPYQVLLGIDRLDYTKGLIERFLAFELALDRYAELLEQVVLFQLVIPSRENVPEYRALKRELDRLVGRINGRFSTPSWQPIRYLYNTVSPPDLCALYRLASAALVTPLRDGMNLVAKEYCACQVEERGVLVLSEFAGAAAQLGEGAVLVNPYDIDATAGAIYTAVTMADDERRRRMRALRRRIKGSDVFWWAKRFVDAALEPTLERQVGTRAGPFQGDSNGGLPAAQ